MTDKQTLDELKIAAFEYAKAGLFVLPLAENMKNPSILLPDWKKYQTQKPTDAELEEWFSNPRVTGVAVICGKNSGLTAIDDDNYKTGNPLPLTSPLEVRTASGGLHLYFKNSPNLPNKTVVNEQYAFEIRTDNLITVLPPSRAMNKNGEIGQYQWLVGDISKLSELPELPADFIKKFASNINTRPPLIELVKAPLGTQHHNLRDLTHTVLSRFKPEEWDELAIPFIKIQAAQFEPPHPPERVERMIKDCVNFRLNKMANDKFSSSNRREGMSYDSPWENEQQDNSVNRSAVYQFNPSKLGELSEEDYEVDWVWEGVAAKGRLTIFCAFPKTGKTTLLAHLVKRTELGGDLADGRVEPVKVLILSEESVSDWVQRREELGIGNNVSIQCSPILSTPSIKQWESLMGEIIEYCKKEDVGFVIFDTISSMWPVLEENSAGEVNRAFLGLRLLTQSNLSVMLVHHTNKNGGGKGRAVRGSGAINANGDFIAELDFVNDAPTQRSLSVVSRLRKEQTVVLDLVNSNYLTIGSKAVAAWENKTAAVLTLIPASGKGLTVKQIWEAWDKDVLGSKPNQRTIRRHVEELFGRGLLNEGDRKLSGKTFATTYVRAINSVTERVTGEDNKEKKPDVGAMTTIINPLIEEVSQVENQTEQLPAFTRE